MYSTLRAHKICLVSLSSLEQLATSIVGYGNYEDGGADTRKGEEEKEDEEKEQVEENEEEKEEEEKEEEEKE